ncbi:MAG TPA: hypothetical protein PLA77_11440, partial [Bacteroidales bacterium]|nr:hypothetical protein [Bacteroidales bacterium]
TSDVPPVGTHSYYPVFNASGNGCNLANGASSGLTVHEQAVWANIEPGDSENFCVLEGVYLDAEITTTNPTYTVIWQRSPTGTGGWSQVLASSSGIDYPSTGIYYYRPVYSSSVTGCTLNSPAAISTLTVGEGNWMGRVSNDWNTAMNWCGGVPGNSDAVEITGITLNQPVISSNVANVCSVFIDDGGTLTLQNNQTLNVYCDFTNLGIFNGGNNNEQLVFTGAAYAIFTPGVGNYNNVTINKINPNAVVMLETDITVNGDVVINNGIFDSHGYNLIVYGDWEKNGGYDASGSVVTLKGSTKQRLFGSSETTFYDLIVENENDEPDAISIESDIRIYNNLQLNTGIISFAGSGSLRILSTATSNQGNTGSFVNGLLRKDGTTAFIFPVGRGTIWAPIGIAAPAAMSAITAEYRLEPGPLNWSAA